MNTFEGYYLIKPGQLAWRPSNLMRIPNADFLERTGSQNLGARLWRMPPKSANTLHKPLDMRQIYPVDPKQLPPELKGVEWPPSLNS